MSEGKNLIVWSEVNKIRGHSPTAGRIRKNNIDTLSKSDKEAVEALIKSNADWVKKYTKTK